MLLETERLIIRPLNPSDADALFAYRADKSANAYQGWIPETRDQAEAFIAATARQIDTPNTWFQLALVQKSSQSLVGDLGIHFFDPDGQQVALGYTLHKAHQGQGYATEALRATIQYLFAKLHKHRITASTDPANTASIRLLRRLGFRQEAHHRQSFYHNGRWADDLVFALLAAEWRTEGTV